MNNVNIRRSSSPATVGELARWWHAASEAERFWLIDRAIKDGTPSLAHVQLAALIAELEAGAVSEG